jgi:hypothetical protein
MQPAAIELLKVYPVDGRSFVHAPAGRGEELRVHLASHGIQAEASQLAEGPFDRLELEGCNDVEAVQAILDLWER